jgi:hypothetical protein
MHFTNFHELSLVSPLYANNCVEHYENPTHDLSCDTRLQTDGQAWSSRKAFNYP